MVQNYYTELIQEGSAGSGEEMTLSLSENAVKGLWKITANFEGVEGNAWFNVAELEKAEIKLENSNLIITNIGNVYYRKPISISIGDHSETAIVRLGVGQTKEIKLTAPEGEYNVVVSDGTDDNTFEISGVSLTGNVVGLEKVGSNFWKDYPMVSLFLGALVAVVVIVGGLKIRERFN